MAFRFCDSLVLGAALVVTSASGLAAEAHDPVTVSHGYSYFGDLKYPKNFQGSRYKLRIQIDFHFVPNPSK